VRTPLTQACATTITVGTSPEAVAFDSHLDEIFVANYGASPGTVSVISDKTNTVTKTITGFSTRWYSQGTQPQVSATLLMLVSSCMRAALSILGRVVR